MVVTPPGVEQKLKGLQQASGENTVGLKLLEKL